MRVKNEESVESRARPRSKKIPYKSAFFEGSILTQYKLIISHVLNGYHLELKPTKFLLNIRNYSSRMAEESMKRIAVCQMTSVGDKAINLSIVEDLIAKASKDNAKMIFFPEACDYIAESKKSSIEQADKIVGGHLVTKYRELAKQYRVWLSMGGIHEKDEENQTRIFNTHIIINNTGDIVQTYRKIHLFDVEIPEKNIRLKESEFTTKGQHIVVPVQTPVGRVGMAICYDLRFPELSTELASLGSDILTYPSAFTYMTGKAHWEILLRARAIETQCYIIAAAQVGHHNEKRRSYGHAMCVDPWGTIVATCGDNETPCYAIADLDYNKLKDVRMNMPLFEHRRNDIYSLYPLSIQNKLPRYHRTSSPVIEERPPQSITPPPYEGRLFTFGPCNIRESCVFYETELCYAFVNLRCVVPGHVLVAPLRFARRVHDLTREEAEDFFRVIILVQKVMERVHKATSSTVTIQDGPDAGQTIEHVHCHIMPRHPKDFKENDLIYLELAKHDRRSAGHPMKPARTMAEMEKEADGLRKVFQEYR